MVKSIFIVVTETYDNKKVLDINVWGFIFYRTELK